MNPNFRIILFTLTIISSINFSYCQSQEGDTSEVKWYSMPPDEIELKIFQSENKKNPTKRPDYMDWVDIRNAFRFSNGEQPIAKLVKYFEPENKNYYKDTLNFAALFLAFACITGIGIIIYLIMRLRGGCMGPKKQKHPEKDDKSKWTIVTLGVIIGALGIILILIFSQRQ